MVFIIAVVDWHFTWQSCQTIARGLAERGYDVQYVNPIPKRLPGWRDVRRVLARLVGRPSVVGFVGNPLPQGVTLWNPLCLPAVSPVTSRMARWMLGPLVSRLSRIRHRYAQTIVINALPLRLPHQVSQTLQPNVTMYLCQNHWEADPLAPKSELCEDLVLQTADLVLADSDLLYERCHTHQEARRFPAMVDLSLFRPVPFRSLSAHGEPKRLRCIYFGDISWRLDLPLLAQVSHRYQLRLVGPVRSDLSALAPETEVLGPVAHHELQRYLDDADVLLLPYAHHEFVRGVMPAKLFEYFATGLPIVATDALPTLERYADVVRVAKTHQEYLSAIAQAPHESPDLRRHRLALAQENSVDVWMDRLDAWCRELL